MFLYMKMIPVIKFHVRRFHVTPSTFLRKMVLKTSFNEVEKKYIDDNFNSSPTRENSYSDYLGIESDEGVITINPQKHPLQQTVQTRKRREKFHSSSFGVIRYDADNKLKFHGQYGRKEDFIFPHCSSENVEVCNSYQSSSNNRADKKNIPLKDFKALSVNDETENKSTELNLGENKDVNYIEEYYFGSSSVARSAENNLKQPAAEELNFVDKGYFRALSTPENPFNENDISSKNFTSEKVDDAFSSESHRHIFSKENGINDVSNNESSFFDKNYFGNISNGYEEKIVNEEFSGNLCFNKETSQYSSSDLSRLNSVKISDEDAKSNEFCNSAATSTVENNDTVFKNSSYNQLNIENKMKTVTELDKYFENNELNERNNDSLKQNLKKTYQNHENSRISTKKLKSDIISKETVLPQLFVSDISDELDTKTVKPSTKENIKFSKPASDEQSQDDQTAHDFITKLREEKQVPTQNIERGKRTAREKFDSKGFRVLTNQVDNLSHFTRDEILNILKKNVVYSDDNLLVLNKPYGLVIHDSQTTKFPCLSMYLDDLAKEMDRKTTNPKLITVHRLDKETTGCLLLARNELMAQNLTALFAQRKIIKKYWIVTVGVPDPIEGVINIPISEGSVDNKKRMVLHPILPKDIDYKSHSRHGRPAITSYKVITQYGNAALVEANPATGVKHQIRVHFGFGLGCPILGDHKYSHLDKLVPQKLPSDMLQRLFVRQSKVRHIPMHIHAKNITIPQYFEAGNNLFVSVPLPSHITTNLKRLKIRKKS